MSKYIETEAHSFVPVKGKFRMTLRERGRGFARDEIVIFMGNLQLISIIVDEKYSKKVAERFWSSLRSWLAASGNGVFSVDAVYRMAVDETEAVEKELENLKKAGGG